MHDVVGCQSGCASRGGGIIVLVLGDVVGTSCWRENALRGPVQFAVTWKGSEHPPLRDNLPFGRWSPLERHNNQPPVDRPPLEVVLPPLEGELFDVLLGLLVLCLVVPLLLRPRF